MSEPLPLAQLVSSNIRAEAGRLQYSQAALAEAMGMSKTATNARYKGNTPWTVAQIERIADLFDISPATLWGTVVVTPTRPNPEPVPAATVTAPRPKLPRRQLAEQAARRRRGAVDAVLARLGRPGDWERHYQLLVSIALHDPSALRHALDTVDVWDAKHAKDRSSPNPHAEGRPMGGHGGEEGAGPGVG